MKKNLPKFLPLTAISAFLLLYSLSCGGGAGIIAGGGIDGTGIISRGIIAAFGSIVVNGSDFDTTNAEIVINGVTIGTGDEVVLVNLDIGRVVTVQGPLCTDDESCTADRVIYSDNVKGPVQAVWSIDNRTKEIVVLGQTVILNVNTKFENTGFDTIAVGSFVEVSGLFDDAGTIWATFIGKTGEFLPELEVEVTGYLMNLDDDLMAFTINELLVDYSSADTGSLPDGTVSEGDLVEVHGYLDESGTVLVALAIEPGDDLDVANAEQTEFTGFVTAIVSTAEFFLGNQPVIIDPEAIFIDGSRDEIMPGAKLEAEGSLIDGNLHAWEIEFWEPDQVEIEDVVTAVASADQFTVGDQVIQTDENTLFENGTADDIEIGVDLEIKGVPADIDFSIIIADKVSFEDE
ncbi:MAG: DUF5666 domain-containing protein [Desulfobulbales bacterium]|nr:DUF5666 domain-containing protein [Desulfobulbales bacterium]